MKDYSEAPMLTIWEVTQACDLACRHCRASARPERDERELTTQEGFGLLEQIRDLGNPIVVFTGGDPLKRPDLFRLLERSVQLGLRTTVTPSATPLLTRAAVARFKDVGVSRMAVSLDGPDAASHDGFRGVAGSFSRTMAALADARRIGLETQINSTATQLNRGKLPAMAELVEASGAKLWSVFFLVVTGRALAEDDLSAEEYERVFSFLYETSLRGRFDIKTTEAPHYRRYAAQQRKLRGEQRVETGPSMIARHAGINDGKGLVFVSHTGEVYPSGFLEVSGGNVRETTLAEAYRNSSPFRLLRDVDQLEGKCGECEFKRLCGGSRSRAMAATGSYLASDPRCVYQPAVA